MQKAAGGSGVEELRDAIAQIGLRAESPSADAEADLVLINPAGGRILVQVKRLSLASGDSIETRIRQWDVGSDSGSILRVVVADRVTQQARRSLKAANWGWLDLRGHMHLVGEGLFVDTAVLPLREAGGSPQPLSARADQEVAALLLLDPTQPGSIRETARVLGRSASTVSRAMASMRQASLVDDGGRPVIPDLFWELAEHWKPESRDLQHPPPEPGQAVGSIEDALRLGLNDVEATAGWALTDTVAAAAYGAPIGARSDHPPDFYVQDQAIVRRALHLLGAAPNHEMRGATIRVASFPLICTRRVDWRNVKWPVARPLFVALDLAGDPGRGREVLDGWTPPPEAGPRVW